MSTELELGPGPNTTQNPFGVGYLLSEIGTNRVMHIEILATVCAALLGFQALLGSRRRRCGSKAFLLPLWAAYTVSSSAVSYTLGLVQNVEESDRYNIQQWWAVGLLLLLGSADAISAFSRHDVEQSKGMQTQHILQTLLVLWLLFSRGNLAHLVVPPFSGIDRVWTFSLLLCWLYSIVKMAQRLKALRMASSSHGLVRSAKVVADYMHVNVAQEHGVRRRGETAGDYDPTDMRGYYYLVHGEDEHSVPPSEPEYRTHVPVAEGKVVTIDMIWQHPGDLLSSSDKRARALKDMCLSFALFKLLKRRFCRLEIAEAGLRKTRDFVLHGLLADSGDYERAFRVVELELSFLYDFFYTKYPALIHKNRALGIARLVFFLGFLSLLYNFISDTVIMAPFLKDGSAIFIFSTFNNFLFVIMVVGIEVLQQLITGYSNWAVVHVVCDYVRSKRRRGGIRQALIKRLAARRAKKSRHWDNKLGQYSLLKSFDYRPYMKNALSWLTLGLLERTREGRKDETAVELWHEVKEAVLRSLKKSGGRLTDGRESVLRFLEEEKRGGRITNGRSSVDDDLFLACNLRTHTHRVLVWHIATTMCDHKDAAEVSDEHRLVATSLSSYCAYLLAFVPEMLPDHSYAATEILDAVVEEARKHLRDSKDMSGKCDKMLGLGVGGHNGGGEGILNRGARLGRRLVAIDDKARRWKLLAEFWTELVLFLAPSDNADVHAEYLARGGEFMTHLWALLTHAGTLDRDPPAPGTSAV